MTDFLFVYGTLLPETGNARSRLLNDQKRIGPGRLCARLFDVGDYPAAVPSDNPADLVSGQVYRLRDPARMVQKLDLVEFCSGKSPDREDLFRRTVSRIQMEDGKELDAIVYFWSGENRPLTPIPGGDYVAYLREES